MTEHAKQSMKPRGLRPPAWENPVYTLQKDSFKEMAMVILAQVLRSGKLNIPLEVTQINLSWGGKIKRETNYDFWNVD